MTEIVDIRQADDPRDVIHRAVHWLVEGGVVALPTETVYVVAAHALQPQAVTRLQDLTRESAGPVLTLALKSAHEAQDYLPDMSPLASRLMRRCWPGPVTFSLENSGKGLLRNLPSTTRDALLNSGRVRLRVPAHDVFFEVLRLLPAPLVVSAESRSKPPVPRAAAQLLAEIPEGLALAIDDGDCRYGEPSSVIEVTDNSWKPIEIGVVTEPTLQRLASTMYLFVCTGNTCRSPMAEGLFRKILAEKLRCEEDQLAEKGVLVASAGVAASLGASAAPEAVTALQECGIDIRSHASQPVTARLLEQADHIFAMTRSHRDAILSERPDLSNRLELLSRDGSEISDPIGCGIEEYRRCCRQIERHLRQIAADLDAA